MNLTLASFLVEDGCRLIVVEYDPDVKGKSGYALTEFKTLDPSIKKDDYVVVPTGTRHGFTVVQVKEIDKTVNYDSATEIKWIAGKVDKQAYDALLEADKAVVVKVGKIEENKKKRELAAAMGLAGESFKDFAAVPQIGTAQPQRAAQDVHGGATGRYEKPPGYLGGAPKEPKVHLSDPEDPIEF